METHSGIDEIDATPATPKLNLQSESFPASSLSELSQDRAVLTKSKFVRPMKPSDDPVLAELERTELEESERAESQVEGSRPESSMLENSGASKAAPNELAAKAGAPVFSSYQQGRQKRRGPLVALPMLMLAAGAFYAVWTYQPGFRDLAQPQIDRVLALAGMAPTPAPNPPKPSNQLAPVTTSAPAPESPADPNQTQSKAPDSATSSATGSATGSPTASAAATAPVPPATTPGTAVAPPASAATAPTTKPEASKASDKPANTKKDTSAATPPDAPLPGENSAIILSSKGAEKRLAHAVPPKYPPEARSGAAQGTVVLKAVVDGNGKVEGLRVVEGNATLATAAIQAVKQWRYRPYVRDGKAQAFQTVVIVDFQRP
jgi:protein TonB